MSNLIVPTFIWHGAPSHRITSAVFSPNRTRLYTGSDNGHICVWSVDSKDSSLEPLLVLFSNEESPITGICCVNYEWKESIVTVSLDGTLSIWSQTDGQCLASRSRVFKCSPKMIRLLPDQTHVAVSGLSADIEVLDLNSLKITHRSTDAEDWIKCLDIGKLGGIEIMWSLSIRGTLRYWPIEDEYKNNTASYDRDRPDSMPIQTIVLDIPDPVHACMSPNNQTLVIVTNSEWRLLTANGSNLLLKVAAPDASGCCYAHYVDNTTIVVWTKRGYGYVYKLPITANTSLNKSTELVPSEDVLPQSVLSFDSDPEDIVSILLNDFAFAASQQSIAVCSEDGMVKIWKINPDSLSKSLNPVMESCFEDGWDVVDYDKKVTASLVIEQPLTLITGYEDGSISISKLPYDTTPSVWKGHAEKINCLMVMKHEGEDFLLSGSDDGYIKTWDMKKKKLVHRLSNQSGPILQLFRPQEMPSGPKWKNRFMSLSLDTTIALYQFETVPQCIHVFGKHSAQIKEVRWQPDQDYLLVQSMDDAFSIWDMTSGGLENCLHGKRGRDIFFAGKMLSNEDIQFQMRSVSKQPFSRVTLHIPKEAPVQAIILNVKQLSFTLYNIFKNRLEQTEGHSVKEIDNDELKWTHPEYKVFTYFIPWGMDEDLDRQIRSELFLKPPSPDVCFGIMGAGGKMSVLVPKSMRGVITKAPQSANDSIASQSSNQILNLSRARLEREKMAKSSLAKDTKKANPQLGSFGTVQVMNAVSSRKNGQWTTSDTMTAMLTLASVSLSKSLLFLDNNKNVCSQLLSYYCALLPDRVEHYLDPSLSYLARFWQDPMEDIMQSARSILLSVVDRLPLSTRRDLAQSWSLMLQSADSTNKSKPLAILVLAILACERADSLTPEIAAQVAFELVDLLSQDNVQANKLNVTTVELLGKGYETWAPHIKDVEGVIEKLFKLSLKNEPQNLATTAHHTLMLIGAKDPKMLISVIGQRFSLSQDSLGSATQLDPREHAHALLTIQALIKKAPYAIYPHLSLLVESLVRSLDPHVPHLREACLKPATTLVHDLCRRFPSIAFDQTAQRLATGTGNKIFVYDLTSATRWHVLEGHKSSVIAIAFSENGKSLASYSPDDGEVKLWKMGSTIFGILGGNPHCYKTINVSKLDKPLTVQMIVDLQVRLQWSQKMFLLTRTWEKDPHTKIEA